MTKAIGIPFSDMEDFTWTVELYSQLIDAGILTPAHKVELLEGTIIKKMAINEPHSACVDGLHEYFYDKYGKKFTYRSENPIILSETSLPEPDFVICERREDRYQKKHPLVEQTQLVIEVADSTVDKDRNYKAVLYANAGVEEYWIINIRDGQIEVHLEPDEGSESYLKISRFRVGESFDSPFNGPTEVTELLP